MIIYHALTLPGCYSSLAPPKANGNPVRTSILVKVTFSSTIAAASSLNP